MQQPPYEQWRQWQPPTQYPPYQPPWQPPPQVVFMPPSQQPSAKGKNETMKTFSILSFIAFAVLTGLSILVVGSTHAATAGGLVACVGFLMFAAGFIFLCLI